MIGAGGERRAWPDRPTALAELGGIVGVDQVLSEPIDLVPYGFDGTAAMVNRPEAVVFPGSTEEVAAVVKWARARGMPLVTRGSGTGLSGGSVPVAGGLVVCLLRLDKFLHLDPANLTALVETGVVTKELDDRAAAHGLFYPPDPGSMKISTIGGNVAENSGGLRGLKYGVTRDYVMGLEVVLPDGRIAWLGGPCVKDVAGYSLKDLFVGSEGTLGIITKVLLRLLPRPQARRTLLATFASMEAAAETVSAIIARPIIPCTLEFLDRRTIGCVEDYAQVGLPRDCEALLLMETDGHPVVVAEEAEAMAAVARTFGGNVTVAADAAEGLRLAAARRNAFSALARLRPTTILEDVTVPRSRLAPMLRRINEIAEKHQLMVATFGHFGDGNLHPTILTDEKDTAEMVRVEAALAEIFTAALELGGTITGEHGVGLAKKGFLRQQLGSVTHDLLREVKEALDPAYLLNPGKIFDKEHD